MSAPQARGEIVRPRRVVERYRGPLNADVRLHEQFCETDRKVFVAGEIAKAQASPGPEHRKLGIFLGRWHTTGEVATTDATAVVKVDAIDTYEWYPGEFFLVHHADGRVGDDAIKSIEFMGYDVERRCYFARFFDSTGGFGTEEIRLSGNTWTWRGSNVMGVKEHRCIAVVSDDGETVNARHERSDDGKNWTLWMDVALRKQK